MSKIVFVPLTDEMVYERPDMIKGPITTYRSTICKKSHRSDRAKESVKLSGAYLKGNLVDGLDVVYVGGKPVW